LEKLGAPSPGRTIPTVFNLSKAIIETKSGLLSLLRQVTASDAWEAWVLYMLDVIGKTAVDTRNKIVAIRELLEKTLEDARKKLPAVYIPRS